jgi:hypothetical protein
MTEYASNAEDPSKLEKEIFNRLEVFTKKKEKNTQEKGSG